MLVEHTFVTTLDAQAALSAAADLLTSRGFVAQKSAAFQMGGGWNDVEFDRGRTNAARAKSMLELPHHVRMEFDRGRISLAASISLQSWAERQYRLGVSSRYAGKRNEAFQQELLLAIIEALELLLVARQPPKQCTARLDHVEIQILDVARRRRRRRYIYLGIFLTFVVLAIGLIVFAVKK